MVDVVVASVRRDAPTRKDERERKLESSSASFWRLYRESELYLKE